MSRDKSKRATNLPGETYCATEEELAAVEAIRAKRAGRPPGVEIRMTRDKGGKGVTLGFEHEDQTTANALAMHDIGTADFRFYNGILEQLARVSEPGQQVSERAANFALGVIAGVRPRDEVEAMLALQMATVHQATMVMARRLTSCDTIPQQDSAARAFNKLARTYAAQVEALKRHRSTGKQVVRVERVTVNEGGQAIVGSVSHGGGVDEKS